MTFKADHDCVRSEGLFFVKDVGAEFTFGQNVHTMEESRTLRQIGGVLF